MRVIKVTKQTVPSLSPGNVHAHDDEIFSTIGWKRGH